MKKILIMTVFFMAACAGSPDVSKVSSVKAPEAKAQDDLFSDKEDKGGVSDGLKPVSISILPFDYSFSGEKEKANEANKALAASLLSIKSFKPSSMKDWIREGYSVYPAGNIYDIIERAKSAAVPIDLICHGKVYKIGDSFSLSISLYPVNQAYKPSYYYRSFSSSGEMRDKIKNITEEMTIRCRSVIKPATRKSIYVSKFVTSIYSYSKIDKQKDVAFVNLPFITLGGVTYKSGESLFSDILTYNLALPEIFNIWTTSLNDYTQKKDSVPQSADYVVSGEILISKTYSVLNITVINNRTKKTVVNYKYPLGSLDEKSYYSAMRENAKMILISALEPDEMKICSNVQIENLASFQSSDIFVNNYYIGNGNQYNLVYPMGSHDLTINGKRHKMFVVPQKQNVMIYKIDENYILDK